MSEQATTQTQHDPECLLPVEEQRAHLHRLSETVLSRVQAVEELDDGYAFEFAYEPKLARTLLERVFIERECCPFFDMELTFRREEGPMTFSFRGPEGTKEMMREQLAKSEADLDLGGNPASGDVEDDESRAEDAEDEEDDDTGCGCGFC